jgi:hypothetical protein
MASFSQSHMIDSSDSEDDGNMVSSWLDEQDEDEPVVVKPVVVPQKPMRVIPKSEYIVDHKELYLALCELEDFDFEKQPKEQQEALMRTLQVISYNAGDNIIVEGDTGNDLFIVVASESTFEEAEVEVVMQNQQLGTEVFLTRLRRGQYFGQKFFVTRREV